MATGQWLGGVGTLGAVWVALWIARRDWRMAQAERADRDKAQARLVWGSTVRREMDQDMYPTPQNAVIRINNRSGATVFKANVVTVDGGHFPVGMTAADVKPLPRLAIEPGGHVDIDPYELVIRAKFGGFEHGASAERYSVTVRFIDASGLWWERTGLDEPVRTNEAGKRIWPSPR